MNKICTLIFIILTLSKFQLSGQEFSKPAFFEFSFIHSYDAQFTNIKNYVGESNAIQYSSGFNYGVQKSFMLETSWRLSPELRFLASGSFGFIEGGIKMSHFTQSNNLNESYFRYSTGVSSVYLLPQIGLAYSLYSDRLSLITLKLTGGPANIIASTSNLDPDDFIPELVEGDQIVLDVFKGSHWIPMITLGSEYTINFSRRFHAKMGLGYRFGLKEFAYVQRIGNYVAENGETNLAGFTMHFGQLMLNLGIGIHF